MYCLGDLVSLHQEEVSKTIPGPNRRLSDILNTAVAPGRIEWYFNIQRAKHSIDPELLLLMPSGTTANEALHRELRRWFSVHTNVHPSTLHFKMDVMKHVKWITHTAALFNPTLRSKHQRDVLIGVFGKRLFDDNSWLSWSPVNSKIKIGCLDVSRQRAAESAAVSKLGAKRPARAVFKRTVFTRKHDFRSVLKSIRKKPSRK